MNDELPKKSPAELLAYQTELLERIAATQQQFLEKQHQIAEAQITWLKSIDEQNRRQVKYLKNVSSTAILIGVLIILSLCGWFWVSLVGFY